MIVRSVLVAEGLPDATVRTNASDRQEQARTRAIEGWLAGLPRDHAIVRVGTHAAVSSLQDQIAALDDLMSAERVSGATAGMSGAGDGGHAPWADVRSSASSAGIYPV